MKETILPKEDQEHGIFLPMMQTMSYYICSQEKILPIKDRQVRKHGKLYRKYQGRDCKGCPLIKFCTTSKRPDYLPKGQMQNNP